MEDRIHAIIPDGVIELWKGRYFIRYDQGAKTLQFATDSDGVDNNETVRWWDKGAASYDFHLAEAQKIQLSNLQGDDDVKALLNTIITDMG